MLERTTMVDKNIQVAFCFDIRMFGPACVSVASLLDYKSEGEHFCIHCIVDATSMERKNELLDIVSKRDSESTITFYPAPGTYDSGYEARGISTATYLRFAIHRLIPDINKIIYLDVDVLICGSIRDLWETDIDKYYFAGVKGTNNFNDKWAAYADFDYYDELEGLKGKYINAGVLVMNLRRIRETQIEEIWMSKYQRGYQYQDQDIINITCKDQILLLPLKYNVAAYLIPQWYKKYYLHGIFSKEECMDAYKNPVILHYAGEKPWKERNAHRSDTWWNYVLSQEDIARLFPKLKKNYWARVIRMVKHIFINK